MSILLDKSSDLDSDFATNVINSIIESGNCAFTDVESLRNYLRNILANNGMIAVSNKTGLTLVAYINTVAWHPVRYEAQHKIRILAASDTDGATLRNINSMVLRIYGRLIKDVAFSELIFENLP
jgi:hypothetical protein